MGQFDLKTAVLDVLASGFALATGVGASVSDGDQAWVAAVVGGAITLGLTVFNHFTSSKSSE
jgi:hypothetical protein